MWQYNYNGSPYVNELYHYGVKGMKWHKHLKANNYDQTVLSARGKTELTKGALNANAAVGDVARSLSGKNNAVGAVASSVYKQTQANQKTLARKYVKNSIVGSLPTSQETKSTAKSILSSLKNKVDKKISDRQKSRISYSMAGDTYKYNKKTGHYEKQ